VATYRTLSLCCVVALLAAFPVAAEEVVLLDTFQDDTPGSPPNGPEIGSYAGMSGTHVVVDLGGGDLRLESDDPSASGGFLLTWQPTAGPQQAAVDYDYRIYANSNPAGLNAFGQELILLPGGLNLDLWWADDHVLRVRITRPGGGSTTLTSTYSWAFDTDYHVSWTVNAAADTFDLKVNGTYVYLDEPLGYDLLSLSRLSTYTNYTTTGSQLMNDVKITDLFDPCAGENTPPVAELVEPPELGAGCLCTYVSIQGTANDPDGTFEQYTLDYRPVGGAAWTLIATSTTPVSEGLLGTWDTTDLSQGYYVLRLTVTNTCGLTSTADRAVFIDQGFDSLDFRYPPDGAVVSGSVCLEGTTFDSWCFWYYTAEYRPIGGTYGPVDPTQPVYTASVVNDPFAHWDTRGLGLADGDYDLRVTGMTTCGNAAIDARTVTLDNTAPTAAITAPLNCDRVSGQVQIIGTAADAHLLGWALQYTGGSASGWVTIATGNVSVINDLLATWDISSLPACAYTLRLVATDSAIPDCGSPLRAQTEFLVSVEVGLVTPGDINCDGLVDFGDINPFVHCLSTGDCGCP
jgi:hypothetical protein